MEVIQLKMGFAKGNKDAIGSSNKSPEKKHNYQCGQCAGIGWLFSLTHGKKIFL